MRTNPFSSGVYDGIETQIVTAEDRLRMVPGFNRAKCEAALKVDGLQKTVFAALQRRLRQLANVTTTICFEDHGQDFLEWDLDAVGEVIECRPFQAGFWCGRHVVNHKSLKKGVYVILDDMATVKYPPTEIHRFKALTP